MRGGHGGRRGESAGEQRGRSDHSVGGGLHAGRRSARRAVREAPGGDQSAEHPVRHQAPDRPPLQGRRGAARRGHGAVPDRRGGQRRRVDRGQGQADGAAGGLRPGAAEDEEDRGRLPQRRDEGGGHHGARVLQRLAAPGDEGCGAHRGPRREADHQRAHRGRPRVRNGQAPRRFEDRGVRPRRRDVRHLDHRDRRDRRRAPVRGAVDERRHVPGRRGLRPPDHRLPRRRVQKGVGHRSPQRSPGPAAAEGSRREGERSSCLRASRPKSTCRTSPPTRADRST